MADTPQFWQNAVLVLDIRCVEVGTFDPLDVSSGYTFEFVMRSGPNVPVIRKTDTPGIDLTDGADGIVRVTVPAAEVDRQEPGTIPYQLFATPDGDVKTIFAAGTLVLNPSAYTSNPQRESTRWNPYYKILAQQQGTADELDYAIDYLAPIVAMDDGDTIASSAWVVLTDLSLTLGSTGGQAPSYGSYHTKVWVIAGAVGRHRLENTITTANGRTLKSVLTVNIR